MNIHELGRQARRAGAAAAGDGLALRWLDAALHPPLCGVCGVDLWSLWPQDDVGNPCPPCALWAANIARMLILKERLEVAHRSTMNPVSSLRIRPEDGEKQT